MRTTFKEYLQEEQQLNEITAKQIIAAGAIAAAALGILVRQQDKAEWASQQAEISHQQELDQRQKDAKAAKIKALEKEVDNLTVKVMDKFHHLDKDEVKAIVLLAKKYEKPTFPKAEDILGIISIESSFDPNAKSGLKHDPAVGLMQVRPAVWGLDVNKFKGDIDYQMSKGSAILHDYYVKFKSKEAAIQAFNIGETAYRKMIMNNPEEHKKNKDRVEAAKRYLSKFMDAVKEFV